MPHLYLLTRPVAALSAIALLTLALGCSKSTDTGAGLKPLAANDWHVLDKAIDPALNSLRVDSPDQTDCKKAIADLLTTFDSLTNKALTRESESI